jgi:hypothetical protein
MSALRLPSVLTVPEFSFLIRRCAEHVRRQCRARIIKTAPQKGNDAYRIPCRELLKFGVDLTDAAVLLRDREKEAA